MLEGGVADPDSRVVGIEMLRAIRQILRQVSRYSRVVSRRTGMGVPQMLCLRAIAEADRSEDVTLARVADTIQLSRSTASALIDKLVRSGHVIRQRSDRDRRRIDLDLSADGRLELERMPVPLETRFLERLAGLPPEERQGLLDALRRIVDLMGADDLEGAPMLVPGAEIDP